MPDQVTIPILGGIADGMECVCAGPPPPRIALERGSPPHYQNYRLQSMLSRYPVVDAYVWEGLSVDAAERLYLERTRTAAPAPPGATPMQPMVTTGLVK